MQLPIRMSSAQALLEEYLSVVDPYIEVTEDQIQSELISDLERLRNKTQSLCESMLQALGYKGSLEEMEKELNLAISELQTGTSYLNGEALGEFFIYELSRAAPYSFTLQEAYNKYLFNTFAVQTQEDLDKIDLQEFAMQLFKDAGIDTNGFEFKISNDGNTIRGFNPRKGSTPAISKTLAYQLLSTSIRTKKLFEEAMKVGLDYSSADVNNNQITYNFQIDENTIYNFLKLKTTPYKSSDLQDINQLLEKDADIVFKVKKLLLDKIISEYHGRFRDIFESTVYYILNKAEIKDLFAGGNAVKKITGLLGEIQALYYIRVLIPDANSNWTATEGSIQPHADIVLETEGKKYGVQVKNTQSNSAKQEVEFESFKTKTVELIRNGNLQIDFTKELATDYMGVLNENPELFNAATGLIGMEAFNVPYLWKSKKKKNKAVEVNLNKVPKFTTTRLDIINAAEKARKALMGFIAGMMYMQLQPLENAEANTLYIIGGTLAVTSATILNDIINNLEDEISNVNFTWKENKSRKGKYTIVDFLNSSSGHHFNQEFTLQSSYTFYK